MLSVRKLTRKEIGLFGKTLLFPNCFPTKMGFSQGVHHNPVGTTFSKNFTDKIPIKKYHPNKLRFPSKPLFIGKQLSMENIITTTNNQKQYKRTDRSVSPETAQKISRSLKTYNATHPRPEQWRKNISNGVHDYWQQIQPKKEDAK